MRHYCTYFDKNFLARGLVLLDSLKKHDGEFLLHVLCLDDDTCRIIHNMNDSACKPISLGQLESFDNRLIEARANRSRVEYYFTLSPFLPLYILSSNSDIPMITYIDADCCFYSSPQPIYDEMGDKSVLVIEHRFSEKNSDKLQYGKFNVGLLVFRQDKQAGACLQRWAAQCAQWCYDKVDGGKFADQGYLNEWPDTCKGLHILEHKGVNVAPWNVDLFCMKQVDGQFFVEDVPLIMYHYHGLNIFNTELCCFTLPGSPIKDKVVDRLYYEYTQKIITTSQNNKIYAFCGLRYQGDACRDVAEQAKRMYDDRHKIYIYKLLNSENNKKSAYTLRLLREAHIHGSDFITAAYYANLLLNNYKNKVKPSDIDSYYTIALNLHKNGEREKALSIYERLIAEPLTRPAILSWALFKKGELLLESGDDMNACVCFENALEIDPHHVKAKIYLLPQDTPLQVCMGQPDCDGLISVPMDPLEENLWPYYFSRRRPDYIKIILDFEFDEKNIGILHKMIRQYLEPGGISEIYACQGDQRIAKVDVFQN